MKKIMLAIPMLVFLMAGVLAQTYYVGDSSFTLPSISVQGTYQNDATHTNYFACISNLDGDSNVVAMNQGDTCEISRTFTPTESELGGHTYLTAIQYVSREWTHEQGWQTISSGVDNSQTYEFNVEYNIPEDDFSIGDWLNGLIDSIQDFFCNNFGLFCPSEPQAEWVYQENADNYVTNGVVGDGWNLEENLYDGDWETSAIALTQTGGANSNFYVNYSKPINANVGIWEVKDFTGEKNITIPSECLDGNTLQLLENVYLKFVGRATRYCYDGSNWVSLGVDELNEDTIPYISEEAVWWIQ